MYVLIHIYTLCADNIHVFFPEASSGVNTSMINDNFQGFTGLPAGIKLFFRHLATKSNRYMGGFYVDSPIWSPKNTCGNDPMRPNIFSTQLQNEPTYPVVPSTPYSLQGRLVQKVNESDMAETVKAQSNSFHQENVDIDC